MSDSIAMRRSLSSVSAGANNYQQGQINQRRPNTIPLKRENISKIRPKLAAYRAEYVKFHFESGLDARDSNDIFAQAIQDRATNNRRRPPPRSVSGAQSERSFVTDVTNDTDGTATTYTFDAKTGAETQEKVKRQLDPLLKARKDLVRSMGTCQDCRVKKIKCSLSHHALEDLLFEFPDAEQDVRWALSADTDPKQAERNITSPTRRSPTEALLLESFAEETLFGTGAQKHDLVGQVNEMFDISNAELPIYPALEVEGTGEMRSPDTDLCAPVYNNQFSSRLEFWEQSPASHDLLGTGMQVQSLNRTFIEPPTMQNGFPTRQRASSNNTRSHPRISLTPSMSYQSTFSAPHSASSVTQQYTLSPQASSTGVIPGSFQFLDRTNDAFLASYNGPLSGGGNPFRCMVPTAWAESSICLIEEFASLQQIISHIEQYHQDYSIRTANPLISLCPRCGSHYAETTTFCGGCGQQTDYYIVGSRCNYGSQMSTSSEQNFASDDTGNNSMSYGYWNSNSDAMSTGNVVEMASSMSNGMRSTNGGFGPSDFNDPFNRGATGFN